MAQSLSKVLVHLVFSTKHREAMLPTTPYLELHAFAQGIFKQQKCHLIYVAACAFAGRSRKTASKDPIAIHESTKAPANELEIVLSNC